MEGRCRVCSVVTGRSCSFCGVHYCGREHQRDDWRRHRGSCAPVRVATDGRLGRHLVATRDVVKGEVLLKKLPLVLAPKMLSYPVCLGCHKRLHGVFYACARCTWPLCGPDCQDSKFHKGECELFTGTSYQSLVRSTQAKQAVYSIIAPIRSALLQISDPKKFEAISAMQSNLTQNMDTPLYKVLSRNFASLQLRLNGANLLEICSIFDTNSYEIRDAKGLVNIRGLYPVVSLVAHDCKVNTKHSFHGDDHEMHVVATVDIPKGQVLATTYTQTLWGTLQRREHLLQVKKFHCTCARCTDATEMGTFAGSIFCPSCRNGSKLLSADPLNAGADWACQSCGAVFASEYMKCLNEDVRKRICGIDKRGPEGFEEFLGSCGQVLHPTNSHVLEVKYALVQLYGNAKGHRLRELPEKLLDRKIELCNELLAVADVLEPGHSRFRGQLLHDLQLATFERIERQLSEGKVDRAAANATYAQCAELLNEAADALRGEPDTQEALDGSFRRLALL